MTTLSTIIFKRRIQEVIGRATRETRHCCWRGISRPGLQFPWQRPPSRSVGLENMAISISEPQIRIDAGMPNDDLAAGRVPGLYVALGVPALA
jgi:hypothetical protein